MALHYYDSLKEIKDLFFFEINERLDQNQNLQMKKECPHFISFKHDDLLMRSAERLMIFDRVKISRDGNFTCPVKSLAIFAHNQDIDFRQNETLKKLNDCKEISDVFELRRCYPDIIPPILNKEIILKDTDSEICKGSQPQVN